MVSVFYDPRFLEHDTGAFHPERGARLQAAVDYLKRQPWISQVQWRSPQEPSPETLRRIAACHSPDYIAAVQRLAERGGGLLDPDTVCSPRSYAVALLAVQAWLDAVDTVLATDSPAFVLARPPGHHALPTHGMGFCIFGNAAIAARYALDRHGLERVAILDWDVHHGNGTQAMVEHEPRIVYCSLHQAPFYPGTGRADEHGVGNILNLPLKAGGNRSVYLSQFRERVLPFLQAAQPQLLIVSAGYDATAADPLAGMRLQPEDYGELTRLCLDLTHRICLGLEGGYDPEVLGQSVAATVQACLAISV
jgi:acetoin utilization deacetylase AcuC-like enzyme